MHVAFARTDHRPWPLPKERWTWRQSWHDLLFAHFPLPVATLRPLVPDALEIQEYDGTSWVGVVPFRMSGVMKRPLPNLPWVSAFPELNVRLYVSHQGKPGVWFLSLDASNALAVWAARRFFHLPYFRAAMSCAARGTDIEYRSQRPAAAFAASYGPSSSVFAAAPGSLEHFLTERYCLYAQAPDGTLWRNDVHHAPWPLQRAHAEVVTNTMLAVHGLTLGAIPGGGSATGSPPLLHFARALDVVVWSGKRVA